jgi:hypothetical protein
MAINIHLFIYYTFTTGFIPCDMCRKGEGWESPGRVLPRLSRWRKLREEEAESSKVSGPFCLKNFRFFVKL